MTAFKSPFPSPGGSGDVTGPASSTDTAVAIYNGITGKLLKNSLATIDSSGNFLTPATYNAITSSAAGYVGALIQNTNTAAGADCVVTIKSTWASSGTPGGSAYHIYDRAGLGNYRAGYNAQTNNYSIHNGSFTMSPLFQLDGSGNVALQGGLYTALVSGAGGLTLSTPNDTTASDVNITAGNSTTPGNVGADIVLTPGGGGGGADNGQVLINGIARIVKLNISYGTDLTLFTTGALVAGTLHVTNIQITANSKFFFTPNTLGTVTRPCSYYATNIVAGSFDIVSSDPTDTSTVNYWFIN